MEGIGVVIFIQVCACYLDDFPMQNIINIDV